MISVCIQTKTSIFLVFDGTTFAFIGLKGRVKIINKYNLSHI